MLMENNALDKEKVEEIAKEIVEEAFGTIIFGIVPADGVEPEEYFCYSCGEIAAKMYFSDKNLTLTDMVNICMATGRLLSH